MTEVEKMMRGELYDYSDPEAMELNLQAHERLEKLNTVRYRDFAAYRSALRELIPGFPDTSYLITPFRCDFGFRISVGEGVVINFNCTFLDGGGIKGAHGVKVDGETLMRAYEARGELAQKVAEFGVGLDGLACRMDADEMQAALQIDDLCRANDTFGPFDAQDEGPLGGAFLGGEGEVDRAGNVLRREGLGKVGGVRRAVHLRVEGIVATYIDDLRLRPGRKERVHGIYARGVGGRGWCGGDSRDVIWRLSGGIDRVTVCRYAGRIGFHVGGAGCARSIGRGCTGIQHDVDEGDFRLVPSSKVGG